MRATLPGNSIEEIPGLWYVLMMCSKLKITRQVDVGGVKVGGGAPVSVQSMTNTFTHDVTATVLQIKKLEEAGCEIVRVAVPDRESARAIREIKDQAGIPIIADVHFDHLLALEAINAGAAGLRINPGNIGSRRKVAQVADAAKDAGIPIRVGVNAGSLEKDLLKKYGAPTAQAMVESALGQLQHLESLGFEDIKVSLKASDVLKTVEAYTAFSRVSDYPLHVGVTEVGPLYAGTVKSSLGIGMLLARGIGDTIRVSLTGDPVPEVKVAWEILKALKLRERGPDIIACPTCGRCQVDVAHMVREVETRLTSMTTPIKIAVMGCAVNGPGEAKEADLGVAGGRGKGILFKKGKVMAKLDEDQLVDVLLKEVREMEKQISKKKVEEL